MTRRLLASLAAGVVALLLTAAATTAPSSRQAAAWRPAGPPAPGTQTAAIPKGVFRQLTLLDRHLTELIDYVEATPPDKRKNQVIDRLFGQITRASTELLKLFPKIYGFEFNAFFLVFVAIDNRLEPSNVGRVDNATGELKAAAAAAQQLRDGLADAKTAGQPVQQKLLDGLDAFVKAIRALSNDVRKGLLKQKGYERRLAALRGMKLDLLDSLPPIFGIPFRRIFIGLEAISSELIAADFAESVGEFLFSMRRARSRKEAFEDLLQKQAKINPIYRELTLLDRALTGTIDDVRRAGDDEWNDVALRGERRILASLSRLVRLLPSVFGVPAAEAVDDLAAIDRAFAAARRSAKGVVPLGTAKTALGRLRTRFEAAEHDGTDVPNEVFEGIDGLTGEIDRLVADIQAGTVTGEARKERIDALRTMKLGLLDGVPAVLGVPFRQIFLRVEAILDHLNQLKVIRTNTFLERKDVLREIGQARDEKEKLEDTFQENAPEELRVGLSVSHTLIDDDPFKAVLCALIETSPGTTIDFRADGPPDSFGPGFGSSAGTTTLAPDQSSTFAAAFVYTPAMYTVGVTASLPGFEPATATQTYQVTAAAQGPFACPSLGPPAPGPGMPVDCDVRFDSFDSTEVRVRGSCDAAASGRRAPRQPLGISITRFDVQLPGGRQVTNWLNPTGFSCSPVTRTSANDTLRCNGNLTLGATFQGNIRMSPGPTTGMGGSFYVFADGAEQGPFAVAGP